MQTLRSPLVRGPYHKHLVALLLEKLAEKAGITQESLADATGLEQTTVGKKLSGKGGTFDLDEAHAALDHINSSLMEFVTDPARVPSRKPEVKMQPVLAKIVRTLRNVHDDHALRIVLATAKSVRASVNRTGKKSGPLRVVAQVETTASSVPKPRRRRVTSRTARREA